MTEDRVDNAYIPCIWVKLLFYLQVAAVSHGVVDFWWRWVYLSTGQTVKLRTDEARVPSSL